MPQFIFTVSGSSLPTWIGSVFAITALYWVATSVTAYWRLRHFKGPRLAAWSDIWWIRTVMSGSSHLAVSEVSTKYGSLARIGPNTILTCNEELYRRANSVRSGYRRAEWYRAFRFDADHENLLSEVNSESHGAMRRKFYPGYTAKENPRLEPDMDDIFWNLFASWKSRYISREYNGVTMDLAQQLQYLTLDIITSISLGKPFGYVTTDSDVHEYISTMHANFPAMTFMSAVPAIAQIIRQPFFVRQFGPSTKDRVGLGKIKAVTSEMISRRFLKRDETRGEDMIQNFIDHGVTQNEIEDNVLLQIVAGSDTSATIMRAGLLHVITTPRIMKKLRDEADDSGVPPSEIVSSARVLELPYLQACIKEALRYHPAASGLLPRVVPPEGDVHHGQFIPGGTNIAFCSWNMHRLNHDVYGPDAHIFRPDRWIEASPERLSRMNKAQELVFGYGEWKCLGYRIALIELHKVFFELVRRFDFTVVNAKHPIEHDINYGMFLQHGLWVTVEDRES